jgi:hypothetical protein
MLDMAATYQAGPRATRFLSRFCHGIGVR